MTNPTPEQIEPVCNCCAQAAEIAKLREQVARLENFINQAPHSDYCGQNQRATEGYYDSTGVWHDRVMPCDCWKSEALAQQEAQE